MRPRAIAELSDDDLVLLAGRAAYGRFGRVRAWEPKLAGTADLLTTRSEGTLVDVPEFCNPWCPTPTIHPRCPPNTLNAPENTLEHDAHYMY